MESAFWDRVVAEGHKVPADRPLADLTAELTTMLGDPDPYRPRRDRLPDAGDLGRRGRVRRPARGSRRRHGRRPRGRASARTAPTRSSAAASRRWCWPSASSARPPSRHAASPDDAVLRWGDRVAGWLVRERDLRGFVPGKGWAHAVAHGADALGVLAQAPAMGRLELTVLLDVIADRLLAPDADPPGARRGRPARRGHDAGAAPRPGRPRGAGAVGGPARRGRRPAADGDRRPVPRRGNVQSYLRALHLQVALAPRPPACRADLLLVLIDQLERRTRTSFAEPDQPGRVPLLPTSPGCG